MEPNTTEQNVIATQLLFRILDPPRAMGNQNLPEQRLQVNRVYLPGVTLGMCCEVIRSNSLTAEIQSNPSIADWFSASSTHSVHPRQHVRRNRQDDLFGGLEINHELKLCWLILWGRSSGLAPFKILSKYVAAHLNRPAILTPQAMRDCASTNWLSH